MRVGRHTTTPKNRVGVPRQGTEIRIPWTSRGSDLVVRLTDCHAVNGQFQLGGVIHSSPSAIVPAFALLLIAAEHRRYAFLPKSQTCWQDSVLSSRVTSRVSRVESCGSPTVVPSSRQALSRTYLGTEMRIQGWRHLHRLRRLYTCANATGPNRPHISSQSPPANVGNLKNQRH